MKISTQDEGIADEEENEIKAENFFYSGADTPLHANSNTFS